MFETKRHITFFAGTCLSLVLLFVSLGSYAQETEKPMVIDRFYNKPSNRPIRGILSKFSFDVSTGYSTTRYSHTLDNVALIQKSGEQPYVFAQTSNLTNDTITTVYANWFNTVETIGFFPVDTSDYIISSDSADLKFVSRSRGIPLNISIHYEFLKNYRVGIGMSWEFHKVKPFSSKKVDNIASFQPPVKKVTFKRYYLYLGGRVWRYYDYSLVIDGQIGLYNLQSSFDNPKGVYFNLGASLEYDLSEYLTAFVRPSYEYKRFETTLPEASLSVNHKMSSIFVNVGVHIRLPELPRCRISNCETQLNHTHGGGKEWRSRSHPFYKKQNPHYGENFPKLIKYKWKNRNKLNPY